MRRPRLQLNRENATLEEIECAMDCTPSQKVFIRLQALAASDCHLACLDGKACRREIEFPDIAGLEHPRPVVHQAIEVLEELFHRNCESEEEHWLKSDVGPTNVQTELREMLRSPRLTDYYVQQWRFLSFLIRRHKPTLFFCRSRSSMANLLFLMSGTGSRFSDRYVNGDIAEHDFTVLTVSAGRLAFAPIRICDARNPDVFARVLFDAHRSFEYAVCDWNLAGEEAALAYRMIQDSQTIFLCWFA